MAACLGAANSFAYEVWMGTHLATHAMATNLPAWSLTATKVQGVNINRAPHDTDPASTADWKTIIAQFANATNVMTEMARSEPSRNPDLTNELLFPKLAEELAQKFTEAANYGFTLDFLMFYDNALTLNGTNVSFNWTTIEVQYLRDWLDTNGHANIRLLYDARNFSQANQNWCASPLVDHVMIEASTTEFLGNQHNQITLLQWIWTNSVTLNKKVLLQIPRTEDAISQYAGTRRLAQKLGSTLGYGDNGIRSDRLVFLPVTYNDNYPYLPETTPGGASYANNLTSICLSLLEQRQLFEGRAARLPTVADADSLIRNLPPTFGAIPDQVVSYNTGTGPLTFTIADDLTGSTSLTLTKSSSNPNLVPPANISLGGAGSNRTVTVTPATNQSGSVVINILINDGLFTSTNAFTLTVLAPNELAGDLFSEASDTSIKEDLTLVDQANPTTLLGAGGSNPWVDRCTVYVFQMPDLGVINNPFTRTSFTFNYVTSQNTLKDNDLYALGSRASATVMGNDYYGQTPAPDPTDATLLQSGILVNASPTGPITTSTDGSAALRAYLNSQYAGGTGAGQFVFLRLNSAGPKTGIARATLTMSEGGSAGSPDTRPQINYLATLGNHAPALVTISNRIVVAGQTLRLTNEVTDLDMPAQTLTFSLLSPPPGGAINASSGVFTWRPTLAQATSTNAISVKVTDSGTPNLSATNNFTVTVLRPAWPSISAPGVSNGWLSFTVSGDSGPDYVVQASTNLTTWLPVWTNSSPVPPFLFADPAATNFNQRFYRVRLGP